MSEPLRVRDIPAMLFGLAVVLFCAAAVLGLVVGIVQGGISPTLHALFG